MKDEIEKEEENLGEGRSDRNSELKKTKMGILALLPKRLYTDTCWL